MRRRQGVSLNAASYLLARSVVGIFSLSRGKLVVYRKTSVENKAERQ